MNITKERLLNQVTNSLISDQPIECSFDLLRFTFGFKRISTEVALLGFILGKSEEDLSYVPKREIIQNVLDWAKENGFACCYNGNYSMNDSFTFYKLIEKQIQ